ncbi:MAG TPA: Asd/ArgC dimerization domain-containing protein [Gaiellaceae bacterium]|nr:Asd/ArgC dimerization domain-containing protein [Gaiellaceae bacterium]
MSAREARIGVVGATGAVGTVTLRLLRERGYTRVRAFASSRSAGRRLDGGLAVEEATPAALAAGGLDLVLFSCGTSASRQLVPGAVEGGALAVDKSSAYRLADGYPLVVPEVNGERALEALETTRVVANPNCSTIPLTCVLKPLHDAAGLERVRVATYQAVSGAGARRMERLRGERPEEHDLEFDWPWEGDETEEEAKLRAETRKILELPELPLSATTVRVPVLVGHAQAVWLETVEPLSPSRAEALLAAAPGVRLVEAPTPRAAARTQDVLVGRLRPDRAAGRHGLALFLACDNLVKGAALNAIQIAELLLEPVRAAAR